MLIIPFFSGFTRVLALGVLLACGAQAQSDPLLSWNDGAARQAIVTFVNATTTPTSPSFVPPAERIATFDQDGTLWVEHPMYSQVMYILESVPRLVKAKPELAKVAPYSTVLKILKGDQAAIAKLILTDLEKLAMATLTGMSADTFSAEVARRSQRPALEEALHRAHVPADAGSPVVSACQWLQNVHRHWRRAGFRAPVFGTGLSHPA